MPGGVSDVAVGGNSSCAVKTDVSDGAVWCWGSNSNGQLGNKEIDTGSSGYSTRPVEVEYGVTSWWGTVLYYPVSSAKQVRVGFYHACLVNNENFVRCWGSNTYGQAGNKSASGDPPASLYESASFVYENGENGSKFGQVVDIAAGDYHTCAITRRDEGAQVYCWGRNNQGQLGIGQSSTAATYDPQLVQGLPEAGPDNTYGTSDDITPISIETGGSHTCVVMSDGSVRCWGDNSKYQAGNSSTSDFVSPVNPVAFSDLPWPGPDGEAGTADDERVVSLSLGYIHTCITLSSGAVRCLGYGNDGLLGNGDDNSNISTPTQTWNFP
jgi:alpha-tubulin suppressor-like RCC1 family protein